ncbi:MAG: hypothetical protein ING71_17295 [Rhodocyclaceae bacterium]|nr:hypothetical protein [Rhodocyclaceae bacterium]
MPRVAIGTSPYKRSSAQMPESRVENYYWEQSPTSESGEIWIPRPGLVQFRAGVAPLRGIFRAPGCLDGDIIAVIGNDVYRINSAGVATGLGLVTGTGRVIIAGNLAGIMVADGTTLQYSTGGSLSVVTLPFSNPIWVGYIAGYWLCIQGGTQKRFWTPDTTPTTWNALNFDSASSSTDRLVGSAVVGGRIWDFGERSIEFRYPSGDSEAPFAVEVGRAYERGCLSRDTIVALDNTAFWVGEDRIVYRGADVPIALSDSYISERIAAVNTADVYAWGFPWQGHVFYCLTIGNQGTFVYDVTTQRWAQWSSYGANRWLPGLGCLGFNDEPLVGDIETGTLYTLDQDVYTDENQPIVGLLTFGKVISGGREIVSMLRIEMATGYATETGQGSNPIVDVRFSRDGGKVWGPWRSSSLGLAGNYGKRVKFNRCGQFQGPGMIGELRVSDPVPRRVSGVYINEAF